MAHETHIIRDFLETYNRIVEECFNRCVYKFSYRYLLDDEIDCATQCTSKYVNFNQRMAMNFGTYQAQKMVQMAEQMEQQQPVLSQQSDQIPAQTISTPINSEAIADSLN